MGKYIDADRLKTEIEKLKQLNEISDDRDYAQYELDGACGYEMACEEILSSITSLQQEQPEVDLKKEIEEHVKGMPMSEFTHESEVGDYWGWAREEFRYFFELGLNARKDG